MKTTLLLGGIFVQLFIIAQCPNDNTFYLDITPTAEGESETAYCVYGGEYYTVDVESGESYTFSTCGGSWDTQITLYNSTGGSALAYNDDACGYQSEITWEATFTGTLWVLVDAYNCTDYFNCGVNLVATWGSPAPPPSNDACENAISITCDDTISGTTEGANYDGLGGCGTSISAPGVWYSFNGTGDFVTFDLCTNDYDTKINVFSGDCGSLSCVSGNDDACGTGSMVSMLTSDDTTYFIYVQGYGGTTGTFELSISCETYSTNLHQDCGGALTICTDGTFDGNSSDFGDYQDLNGSNNDCLTVEHQSQWFVFSPVTSGTIGFTLTPSNGIDYDFAIWGPYDYDDVPCPPDEMPLRCSYSALYEPTGLALSAGDYTEPPSGDAWVEVITVTSEELNKYYLMLIDNFTADNTSFSFDWNLDGVTLNCAIMLPVELTNFTGQVLKDRNELSWTTASELNNSHFEVERSIDGVQFEKIGEILGQGTTSFTSNYLFNDRERPFGTAYYRLRQIDLNGAEEVLPTIALTNDSHAELMSLYPNPGKGVFACDLKMKDAKPIGIQVYDLQSRIVSDLIYEMDEGVNHMNINLADLRPGTYIVVFLEEEGPFATERVILKPK